MKKLFLFLAAFSVFLVLPAKAQLLVGNALAPFSDNNQQSFIAYQGKSVGTVFTPSISASANHVTFDGFSVINTNTPSAADTFLLTLYSVGGSGAPDQVLGTSMLSNLTTVMQGTWRNSGALPPVYEYSASLSTPFDLTVGTSYFFDFTNTGTDQDFTMIYMSTGNNTDMYVNTDGAFHSVTGALAFELNQNFTQAVPEPSSYALGLIALTVLGAAVYRRRGPADGI